MSSFSFGGHRTGKDEPHFDSGNEIEHFDRPLYDQSDGCFPIMCVVDPSAQISDLSQTDQEFLTLVLGLKDPSDFLFAAESDLASMVRSSYDRLAREVRADMTEASILLRVRRIYLTSVKNKTPITTTAPSPAPSENNNHSNGSVWGSVAVTRSAKSIERDATKFPNVAGGAWDGFRDILQRPVKVFVREVGQVGSEQSMTVVELYRYLCNQLSPTIKRELSEFLNGRGLLNDNMASPRLTECESWLLNTFNSTNSSTRLLFRLETLQQSGDPVDNYITKFRSLLWESEVVGLHWQADFILQQFTSGLDQKYCEYADSCNLLSSDVSNQSFSNLDRLISSLRDWEIRQVSRFGHRPNERGGFVKNIKKPVGNVVTNVNTEEKDTVNRERDRPCFYFKRTGRCRMGDHCKFSHVRSAVSKVPSVNSSSQTSSQTSEITNNIICGIETTESWWDLIPLESSCGPIQEYGLLDTGAGCNCINKGCFDKLSQICDQIAFKKLDHFVEITFGSGQRSRSTESCVISFNGNEHTFLIVENLHPEIILGRPYLMRCPERLFDLVGDLSPVPVNPTSEVNTATIVDEDVYHLDSENRFVLNCPLFEKAAVLPREEPCRLRNPTNDSIINWFLSRMVASGYLEHCSEKDVALVSEVVLIDKFKGKGVIKRRVFPVPDDEQSRYRVTADLRPVNALKYESGMFLVPDDFLACKKSTDPEQSQPPILNRFLSWPSDSKNTFAKVDITEAYHCIGVNPGLSRLFGIRHQGTLYRYRSMPQGWRWSPIFFDKIMGQVVHDVQQELQTIYGEASISVLNVKDDILIGAMSKEICQASLDFVKARLRSHRFIIHDSKCTEPSSDVVFCGYHLISGGAILPMAAKTRVTQAVLDTIESDWQKQTSVESKIRFLRSWIGTFNYVSHWLPPVYKTSLHSLNETVSFLVKGGNPALIDHTVIFEHIQNLGQFYMNSLPQLYGFDKSVASLLVCDANCDSWSSISLSLSYSPETSTDPIPFNWSNLTSKILNEFPSFDQNQNYSFLPLRFDAGKFTSRERTQRSSTYRERVAILRALELSDAFLKSPVIVVTDNENVTKTWRDVEQTLTASDFSNFERFQERVTKIIHLKRLHPAVSIVDSIARNFAKISIASDFDLDPIRPSDPTFEQPPSKISKIEKQSESLNPTLKFINFHNFVYDSSDSIDSPEFFEQDGLYFHKSTNSLLVPVSFQFPLLKLLHDLSHQGKNALISLCKHYNLLIPHLDQISSKIVSECDACNRGKSSYGGPPYGHLPKPSVPFTIVAMDFLTINDLKLLVMVDLTSSFIDVNPVDDMSGPNTLSAIKSLFYRWGFPSALLTDNGKSFIFDPLQQWLKSVGITSLLTPLYSPQSNGKCERAVRSVLDSIRITFLNKRLSSIPIFDILPEILYGLNSVPKSNDTLSPRDYIFCYRERCPFIQTMAPANQNFKGNFKIGEKVLLKSTTPNLSKLEPRFDDLGTISEHIANYVYKITRDDGRIVKFRENKIRRQAANNQAT